MLVERLQPLPALSPGVAPLASLASGLVPSRLLAPLSLDRLKSPARPHIRMRDGALSNCWSYLQHRHRPVFGSCPSLTASVIGNSCYFADGRIATGASRQGPGEGDDQASSHCDDRVGNVPLGSD